MSSSGGSVTLDVSPDMLRRQITLMGSWIFGSDATALAFTPGSI